MVVSSANAFRLRSTLSILVLALVWELVARAELSPPLFLPALSAVLARWWSLIQDGSLITDLGVSFFRAGVGLAVAMAGGVVIGMSMSRYRLMHWLFDPLLALGFPAPKIAFLPVFILWFGIYSLSKIILVTFACIFPIIIGTYAAARSVNRAWIWSAESMGTPAPLIMAKVIFPACLPKIFAALRVALPVALITTFTAEMVAGGGGMGATLMYAQRFFESPTVFAYILTMLLVGLILDFLLLRMAVWFPILQQTN